MNLNQYLNNDFLGGKWGKWTPGASGYIYYVIYILSLVNNRYKRSCFSLHQNPFITLLLGSKLISVLAIQSVLYTCK